MTRSKYGPFESVVVWYIVIYRLGNKDSLVPIALVTPPVGMWEENN